MRTTVVCVEVGEGYRAPGSEVRLCADCGTRVWFSPSSQRLEFEQGRVEIVCVPCQELRPPEGVVAQVLPGAIVEIREYIDKTRSRS